MVMVVVADDPMIINPTPNHYYHRHSYSSTSFSSSNSSSTGNTSLNNSTGSHGSFMMSTILFFIVCSIVIVSVDYQLEQSMNQHMLLVSQSSISSSSISISTLKKQQTILSPLHDPTLQWDNVQYPHAWLAYEQQQRDLRHTGTTNDGRTGTLDASTDMTKEPGRKPPYMILLTEYGWNHPNTNVGLTFARCIRSTEYLQSIVNHPYFHPTAYREIMIYKNRTVDPDISYYLFLDVETCYESNYPNYGKSYRGNCDTSISTASSSLEAPSLRPSPSPRRQVYSSWYIKYFHPRTSTCYDFANCHYLAQELQQNPIFISSNTDTQKKRKNQLIVLDCRGNGQVPSFRHPSTTDDNNDSASAESKASKTVWGQDPHLVVVSLSSTLPQLNMQHGDQGLPPPVLQKIPYQSNSSTSTTTLQYQHEILQENCASFVSSTMYRKYLLSFSGDYHRHSVRQQLAQLDTVRSRHDHSKTSMTTKTTSSSFSGTSEPMVLITDTKDLYANTNGMTYSELLLSSQYVAVPRGDNLYSYRFSEVLSSGAIPVLIHNSEWVLPFRHEIVQWERCVIWIAAEQIPDTVAILQNISDQEQCHRRQYCYSIYERYMMNSTATIHGILDGLQAMAKL